MTATTTHTQRPIQYGSMILISAPDRHRFGTELPTIVCDVYEAGIRSRAEEEEEEASAGTTRSLSGVKTLKVYAHRSSRAVRNTCWSFEPDRCLLFSIAFPIPAD